MAERPICGFDLDQTRDPFLYNSVVVLAQDVRGVTQYDW